MADLNKCYVSLVTILILVLSGCASKPPRFINLMPAPDVYSDEGINPFADSSHIADSPYWGMLYATDRAPADDEPVEDLEEKFYSSERGHLVRLGLANIELGGKRTLLGSKHGRSRWPRTALTSTH